MSALAKNLQNLCALPAPHGALTQHLMREIAQQLIARGAA